MAKIVCHLEAPIIEGDFQIRSCVIERDYRAFDPERDRLYFKLPKALPQIADNDAEPFLIACVMTAMAEQADLFVKGCVSPLLMANIEEFCDTWNCWLPETYKFVDIDAEQVADLPSTDTASDSSAIAAFSGGVDATFTVWRHFKHLVKYRAKDIVTCAMILGIDMDLSMEAEFCRAFERAEATLASCHIPLVPIRTNFRQVVSVKWEHVFVTALVSCLYFLKSKARNALVGSSAAYNNLVFPWSSNPITDHLLSSHSFSIIHDGASANRVDKIKAISSWSKGCEDLRVCWVGRTDTNCGHCEKCIRTKLSFMVNRLQAPEILGPPVEPKHLRKVILRNHEVYSDYRQIYNMAVQNSIDEKWLSALEDLFRRHRFRQHTHSLRNQIKKVISGG